MTNSRPLAITVGEPAGIGPEIVLKALPQLSQEERQACVVIGNHSLLESTAQALQLPMPPRVINVPLGGEVIAGTLNPKNRTHVLEMLSIAAEGANQGTFAGVVTGPVQKSILDMPDAPFTGHTEFFAYKAKTPRVVMMLTASADVNALKIALVTTHLPISQVPSSITAEALDETLEILHTSLHNQFGISCPKIAVTGLNPHAGESGHIGTEEITTIIPAITRAQAKGWDVSGPWPADTLLIERYSAQYDAILCMYHDQGLPVLKRTGFGHAVNVTLGLPWVRTSVDHGTALNIAGQYIADEGSLLQAISLARHMTQFNRY